MTVSYECPIHGPQWAFDKFAHFHSYLPCIARENNEVCGRQLVQRWRLKEQESSDG